MTKDELDAIVNAVTAKVMQVGKAVPASDTVKPASKSQGKPASDTSDTDVLTVTVAINGKTIGMLNGKAHTFKSGNTGFLALGKVEYAGKRYQCNSQMALVRTK